MRKNTITILFLACIAFSCSTKIKNKDIDIINYAIQADKKLKDTLVDSVKFIKLLEPETNQFSSISKIILKENYIYILDKYGSGGIFVFDKNGKFISPIGKIGRAENEYIKAWDFDVTQNGVIVYDRGGKKLLWYTKEGIFIKSKKTDFVFDGLKSLKDGNLLVALGLNEQQNEVCVVDSHIQITKTLLKFREGNKDDKITDNVFQQTGDVIIYNRPINNIVYVFDEKGMYGCQFDFFNRNVPVQLQDSYDKFITKGGKGKYIYMYDCPIRIGQSYVFSVFCNGNKGALVYNTKLHVQTLTEWKKGMSTNDIILPLYSDGYAVYGWMDDSVYELIKDKENISDDIKNHLLHGGKVITVYYLNRELL